MTYMPSWTQYHQSPEEFTATFSLPFSGPGLYTTATDTLLVIPRPPDGLDISTIWHVEQPEGTHYEVHVWNSPFRETVLSTLSSVPTRT